MSFDLLFITVIILSYSVMETYYDFHCPQPMSIANLRVMGQPPGFVKDMRSSYVPELCAIVHCLQILNVRSIKSYPDSCHYFSGSFRV